MILSSTKSRLRYRLSLTNENDHVHQWKTIIVHHIVRNVINEPKYEMLVRIVSQARIQRRSRGSGPPPPPPLGKSLVIWVPIENKQLDPPPGKMLDPLWNLGKL